MKEINEVQSNVKESSIGDEDKAHLKPKESQLNVKTSSREGGEDGSTQREGTPRSSECIAALQFQSDRHYHQPERSITLPLTSLVN